MKPAGSQNITFDIFQTLPAVVAFLLSKLASCNLFLTLLPSLTRLRRAFLCTQRSTSSLPVDW
jgi:hypothetical protein